MAIPAKFEVVHLTIAKACSAVKLASRRTKRTMESVFVVVEIFDSLYKKYEKRKPN